MNKTHFRYGAHAFVAILLLTSSVKAATLEALWEFDETTGGIFADSSGNGRNGTIVGTVDLNLESAIPGVPVVGRSAEFTGGTSSANVGTYFNSLTNNFAIAGWVDPDTVAGFQRIFASDRAAGASGWAFGLNGSNMRFTTLGVLDYNSGTANLLPQTWKHIAVNFDADNDATFYVNGVQIGTAALGTNPALSSPANNFYIARAGVTGTGVPTEQFIGRLDGLRVYSGTLTAGEVQTLATVPNLRGYWALDELSGTTAGDSSGYHASGNMNGTYQSGPVLGQSAAKSRFGTSVDFDGVNDEVFLNNGLGTFTNNFTIAAWINPDTVSGFQRILSSSVVTPSTGFGFGLNGTGLLFTTYGILDYNIAAGLTAGTWTHVAVSFDSANDATFFVNGVNIGTVSGLLPANVTTNNFFIGRTGLSQAFNGRIDEVRFYDRALSESEIAALIPEPSSFTMLLFGALMLAVVRGKRSRNGVS